MNDKVRTINIEGIEIQTSLTPVELAGLPQKYSEVQSNWNSLREWLEMYSDDMNIRAVLDKMNELEKSDSNN